MQYTWDVNILSPIIFILLSIGFSFYLVKLNKIKKDGIFLLQQFCFWSSIYIIMQINQQYSLSHFLNHNESIWLTIFLSIGFYSIFLFIPANLIAAKFRNRKIWFYLSHILTIPSIFLFICWTNLITAVILAIAAGFAAASTSTAYLFYSENFQHRVFPFTTMSLIFTVLLLSYLFSINFTNILSETINKNNNVDDYSVPSNINIIYYYVCYIVVFILLFASLFTLFLIKEDKSMFGYCDIQFKEFEPFIWLKGIIIYIFLFFIVVLEQIGHGLLFNWMLEQNTWTKYKNDSIVSLYSRLSSEIYYVGQIIFCLLISIFLIRRIGIKYTFGLGLFLQFIYFASMSFSSNPILLLFLDFISAIGFILILTTLLSLTLMWQTRTPIKKIFPIFSTIMVFTNVASKYILSLLSLTQIGIFGLKDIRYNYTHSDQVTEQLNSQTTIIFTSLAVISLGLLIMFYYSSEFILAEYNNYIYFWNKMSEIITRKEKILSFSKK